MFFVSYQRIAYPPDIIVDYHLNWVPATHLRHYEEVRVADGLRFLPHGAHSAAPIHCPPPTDSLTVLINFAGLYPPNKSTSIEVPALEVGTRILFDGPHREAFTAYEFEGLNPAERMKTQRRQYRLRLLRVANTSAKARMDLLLR